MFYDNFVDKRRELVSIGGYHDGNGFSKQLYTLSFDDAIAINNEEQWKWRVLSKMKIPRTATMTAMVGHKLFIIGGSGVQIFEKAVEVFDLKKN